jgi:hypothetical protein
MIHSENPYFPNPENIYQVKTDITQWPYQRYFRGKPSSDYPRVWDREAGYNHISSPTLIPSYRPQPLPTKPLVFQPACSTIFPINKNKCIYFSP